MKNNRAVSLETWWFFFLFFSLGRFPFIKTEVLKRVNSAVHRASFAFQASVSLYSFSSSAVMGTLRTVSC